MPDSAIDKLTAARADGHSWEAIEDWLEKGRASALAAGHTAEAIDRWLGYQPLKVFNARRGTPDPR